MSEFNEIPITKQVSNVLSETCHQCYARDSNFQNFLGACPIHPLSQSNELFQPLYTHENLATCSKSANKPSTGYFARLVTSCQQVWNKLLITCNKLVDIIRLVTRLLQQGCYNHDITILLQPFVVNLATVLSYHDYINLLEQPCNKSDNAIKLVASC